MKWPEAIVIVACIVAAAWNPSILIGLAMLLLIWMILFNA